jgi:hypothetical protein
MNTKIVAILLATIVAISAVPIAISQPTPQAETGASVNNAAPSIEIVSISPDPAYPPTTVYVSGTWYDPNGASDWASGTYAVYDPAGDLYTIGTITGYWTWGWQDQFDLGPLATPGVWTVNVSVTDLGGLSATDTATFTVGEVVLSILLHFLY